MGTTEDKLNAIASSKAAIKSAIQAKGVSCDDVLSGYAARIKSIQTATVLPNGTKFRSSTATHFPTLKFEGLTNCASMFYDCQDLIDIEGIDNTANVTDMSNMFYSDIALVSVPEMNTAKVTNVLNMCYGCAALVNVPVSGSLDFGAVTNANNAFTGCKALSYARIDNVGCDLNLTDCPLDADSLDYVLSHLKEVTGKTLTLGETNLAKVTEAQKTAATAKGWTLA